MMTDEILTVRSYRDRVEALFKAHPNEWLDSEHLAKVGGRCAWRTRVSDCRVDLGMTIENQVRRVGTYRVSEYRYLPEPVSVPSEAADLNAL